MMRYYLGSSGLAEWMTMAECFGDQLAYANPGITLEFYQFVVEENRKVERVQPKFQRVRSLTLHSFELWKLVPAPSKKATHHTRSRGRGRGRGRGRKTSGASDVGALPSCGTGALESPTLEPPADVLAIAWEDPERASNSSDDYRSDVHGPSDPEDTDSDNSTLSGQSGHH